MSSFTTHFIRLLNQNLLIDTPNADAFYSRLRHGVKAVGGRARSPLFKTAVWKALRSPGLPKLQPSQTWTEYLRGKKSTFCGGSFVEFPKLWGLRTSDFHVRSILMPILSRIFRGFRLLLEFWGFCDLKLSRIEKGIFNI